MAMPEAERYHALINTDIRYKAVNLGSVRGQLDFYVEDFRLLGLLYL
jgi:hypothetical protein